MAERRGRAASGAAAGTAAAGRPEAVLLHRLRDRVDALDREIVGLLNERAAIAVEIGRVKAAAGGPVLDEGRERAVLERVAAENAGPLPTSELLAIYRRLIAATRRLEEDRRGASGSGEPGR